MRIGIDISQVAYENTGVAEYVEHLVEYLLRMDKENEYVLFFSSLRRKFPISKFLAKRDHASHDKVQNDNAKVKIKSYPFPPTVLHLLWNRLHILPIEWFVGDVDVFITSDWVEPPTRKAKKVTILYDLIVYKYPQETAEEIVATQKRRLYWVKKESEKILCISEATKKDAMEILGIEEKRLEVIYPGVS